MADFLTRLASRTLGLAPMAEPVVAPMFAPDAPAPFMAGSDEPLDAGPLDAAQQAPAPGGAAGPPSASTPDSSARPVAERSQPERAAARQAPPDIDDETTSRTMAAAPDDVIVRKLPARPHPQLPAGAASATRAAVEEDALVTPAATPPLARLDAPDPLPTPAPSTEDLVAVAGRPAVRQSSAAPPSWDGGPDEPLLLPLAVAEVSLAQRDASAAGPTSRGRAVAGVTPADETELPPGAERGQTAAVPSSPPTIEVTIGRVEVRAVHPPAPVARPKAATPAAPGLSLEEYLRNQGGRR